MSELHFSPQEFKFMSYNMYYYYEVFFYSFITEDEYSDCIVKFILQKDVPL